MTLQSTQGEGCKKQHDLDLQDLKGLKMKLQKVCIAAPDKVAIVCLCDLHGPSGVKTSHTLTLMIHVDGVLMDLVWPKIPANRKEAKEQEVTE